LRGAVARFAGCRFPRAVMNHEQTEIDALAALRPNDLRRIALDAIKPFYDSTLRSRSARAASIWDTEVRRRLEASPGYQMAVDNISAAREALQTAADSLLGAQQETHTAFSNIELPPVEPPEPVIDAPRINRPTCRRAGNFDPGLLRPVPSIYANKSCRSESPA